MHVAIIQHIECEGPGPLLDGLLRERGCTVSVARMDLGDPVPAECDAMIVLGGPMNVYEEERYPYLADLDRAIRTFVEGGGHYLGFCLGGQLLAKALGAPVTRNAVPEIGLFPVTLTREGRHDPLFHEVPRTIPTIEWHFDTFALPPGGRLLATSRHCRHQAFRFGNALGLQFHPEVTMAMLEEWVEVYAADLRRADLPAGTVLQYAGGWSEECEHLSRRIIGNFLNGL
ncbi:type 1 glutamine amidotransferase [Methanofollis fontis]|nr:type 1 glutamine amidotransferase [Methanofollis fontis]